MESALYGVYTLVVLYQKSHSFASLTYSISDTPQLVCKHRARALSMKYSIFIKNRHALRTCGQRSRLVLCSNYFCKINFLLLFIVLSKFVVVFTNSMMFSLN